MYKIEAIWRTASKIRQPIVVHLSLKKLEEARFFKSMTEKNQSQVWYTGTESYCMRMDP